MGIGRRLGFRLDPVDLPVHLVVFVGQMPKMGVLQFQFMKPTGVFREFIGQFVRDMCHDFKHPLICCVPSIHTIPASRQMTWVNWSASNSPSGPVRRRNPVV